MNENYVIEIDNLMALCHILNDFEEFQKRLLKEISPKYNRNFVEQVRKISTENSKIIGARKAKKFYNENKMVIDTINQYANISKFINMNYDDHGTPNKNFQFFYQYIFQHKENIKQILEVLGKIQKLGFYRFEFNEHIDFTRFKYKVALRDNRIYSLDNKSIIYVANPQVVPSYDTDKICYTTTNSNYKIELDIDIAGKGYQENISKYDKRITVNSLVFDPKTLPANLNKETIFDPLIKAKKEQKEQIASIRNAVDLSICVLKLEQRVNYAKIKMSRLDKVDNPFMD